MRIFKTKAFSRFAKKAKLDDNSLYKAVMEAEQGLIAGDLGGGVIKQRVAKPSSGKLTGFRTIIAYRKGKNAFFIHGYTKTEKDSIENDERAALRCLAAVLLNYDDDELAHVMKNQTLIEVNIR